MVRVYLMAKGAGGVDKFKNENPRAQKEELLGDVMRASFLCPYLIT